MNDNGVLLVVAAALVDAERRVLVQQRPAGKSLAGLWEFPGGKLEPGEAPEAALVRELHEELGVAVVPGDLEPLTFASDALDAHHLVLLLYVCWRWQGDPRPLHASAIRWCAIDQLRTLDMPPADVPLVEALAVRLGAIRSASSA